MKYTVVWVWDAEADLAKLWVNADSDLRRAIQSAADACDRSLSFNAHLNGSSRSGNQRVLYISPLIFDFEVIADDRVARVLSVRLDPAVASSNGRHL